MRVISGKYKGKILEGFDIKGTRPTMDRIKESMFASIQNYLKEAIVLDLFAGSGSLGIEALSNGAKSCYFVDKNKIAVKTITKNTEGISNCFILYKDCLEALDTIKIQFDVILLDPPYHDNFINKVIDKIIDNNLLSDKGIIVCEVEENLVTNLDIIKEKSYGKKKVFVLKK